MSKQSEYILGTIKKKESGQVQTVRLKPRGNEEYSLIDNQ